MSEVFLSYASADRERVAVLVRALKGEGMRVWWDRDITYGESFHKVIEQALGAAACVVVVWTRNSVASEWVVNEASDARKRDRLVPVLMDAVRPPLEFRHLHAADLSKWDGGSSDAEFARLTQAVQAMLRRAELPNSDAGGPDNEARGVGIASVKPAEPDKLTPLHRMLDRVRNNRVTAALVLLGIGIAALTSFTESIKKLTEIVPTVTPQRASNFNGTWMSAEPDTISVVKTILVFDFKIEGGELVGKIHHGYWQALLNGKIDGEKITFDMDQEWSTGGKIAVERQTYRGRLVGDKIQFIRTIAGTQSFEFAAIRKVPQSPPAALRAGGKLAKTKLAFSRRYVWIMNADGSDGKRLTTGADNRENSPAWSRDGSRLAFRGQKASGELGIYVIHADGSHEERLNRQNAFWDDPSWSPDGTRIVFANTSANNPGILVVNSDGSNLTRLTTGDHLTPSFSPDGRRLLFRSRDRLVVADADGSNPRELGEGNHPTWSPDGTKIAFDRPGEANSAQIIVMDADGSHPVTLTEDWARATNPAWSPDGTLIAYVSNRQGESEIFVMGADGSNPVNLSNKLDSYEGVAWSPLLGR